MGGRSGIRPPSTAEVERPPGARARPAPGLAADVVEVEVEVGRATPIGSAAWAPPEPCYASGWVEVPGKISAAYSTTAGGAAGLSLFIVLTNADPPASNARLSRVSHQ